MIHYKVVVDGKEIEYGADTEMSRYSDEEWTAIHSLMVKENYPELYEKYKEDSLLMSVIGWGIALEERYEFLLELLPQCSYSKAGTHPRWIANAVKEEANEWIEECLKEFAEDNGIEYDV